MPNKIQRNLWISPAAAEGWRRMAELLEATGQRDSKFSALYTLLGERFKANPAACGILIKLILDGRMAQPFTERTLQELFDHE